jgi:hypothetical protein
MKETYIGKRSTNTLDMRLIFYFTLLLTFRLVNNKKQPTLDYYLPQNVTYKKNIPTLKVSLTLT